MDGTVKPPRRLRSTLRLQDGIQRRLNSYALAATAAGVGTLALTPIVEAKIVYTPAHRVMSTSNPHQFHPLDVNHDGVTDFTFDAYYEVGMSSQFAFLRCDPAVGNSIWGGKDEAALRPGARVGPGRRYASHITMGRMFTFLGTRSGFYGPWANGGKGVKDRYLGFKFAISGKIHYGWARLNVKVRKIGNIVNITALLTGYAYETIPNKAIIAGKTKGADVVTLQPGSLGHLARGAAAIPRTN
jgi:hypothetical protein